MTTTTRTELALAACQGMSDEELQQRGASGYASMRDRKRKYAAAARLLAAHNERLVAEIAKLKAGITSAGTLMTDAEATDLSQANALLAGVLKKDSK